MNNKLRGDALQGNYFNHTMIDRVKLFVKLKTWVEDSLDLFKNDLIPLLYPIFLHIYIDLIYMDQIDEAKKFYAEYYKEFISNNLINSNEIKSFESIYSQQHIYQNPIVHGFRTNKYFLIMSKYAYNLLINFIEENDMLYILKLMNSYMEIKVQTAGNMNAIVTQGIIDCNNDIPVNLNTSLISLETESSILASEQYKYDHLETFVQQLKKQRKIDNKIKATPSLVEAEIEKLKDICKRVSLNKDYLPSICCYTVQNTYESLTCTEISNDSKLLACGYSDSYIDIHSLTKENLKRLKTSEKLKTIVDEKDSYDEVPEEVIRLVGHTKAVYSLKFSNTNKFLISASADCTIRLWSLDIFECIGVYKAHVFPVWTVDFACNDFYFASGSADKQAILWCTKNTTPERLILSSLSDVTVVKFHPNSLYLFTGSCDYKIRMHAIEDEAQVVRTFVGHSDAITCLDVSCDGRLLISGSRDKKIILWDIEKAQIINIYAGHEGSIFSVSFSYFGTIICSSGSDNSVRLWDKTEVITQNKQKKGECTQPVATYYTKNTPIFTVKFGYRNIVSCAGPFIS